MYNEFTINTIETDLINKKIIITTNMNLDVNSIEEIDATLYHRESKQPISLIPAINNNILELTLTEWPILNTPYIFTLKPIKNVLKELSRSGIKRKIEFNSNITKQVKILSPIMHEAINSLNIKLDIFDNTNLDLNSNLNESIFIEVATDTSFINITNHINIPDLNQKEIKVALKESNQYFIRARVQSDKEIGLWSKTITFIYGNSIIEDIKESEPDYIPDYEDMNLIPDIDEIVDFEINLLAEQGTTPEQIILIANKDLNEDDFSQSQILVFNKKGIIKHTAIISENTIILDFNNPLEDNSIYTIKLMDIKSISDDILSTSFKLTTRTKPLYCDIYDVTALIGEYNIADDIILHNIHTASKFADYILSTNNLVVDEDNVDFKVVQFVKYYAAHECLLRHTVNLSSSIGLKGTVGNVNFSESESAKDITGLLKHFCNEINKWKDALRGYEFEGRARMKSAIRGQYASPAVQPLDIASQLLYGRGDMNGR